MARHELLLEELLGQRPDLQWDGIATGAAPFGSAGPVTALPASQEITARDRLQPVVPTHGRRRQSDHQHVAAGPEPGTVGPGGDRSGGSRPQHHQVHQLGGRPQEDPFGHRRGRDPTVRRTTKAFPPGRGRESPDVRHRIPPGGRLTRFGGDEGSQLTAPTGRTCLVGEGDGYRIRHVSLGPYIWPSSTRS